MDVGLDCPASQSPWIVLKLVKEKREELEGHKKEKCQMAQRNLDKDTVETACASIEKVHGKRKKKANDARQI